MNEEVGVDLNRNASKEKRRVKELVAEKILGKHNAI